MLKEIQLDGLWGGYSDHGARDGENIAIIKEEFSSSEDGEAFFKRLEGGPDVILKSLPNGCWINRALIENLLIVFTKDSKRRSTSTSYL